MQLIARSNDTEPVKTNFGDEAKIVIVDSGVHHHISAGEYQKRRGECEELAAHFQVESLRNLQKKLPQLEELCKGKSYRLSSKNILFIEASTALSETHAKRLRHILTENQRVLEATQAMTSADFPKLGQLMQQSHASLRDDYEVSCKEINELVNISMSVDGVYGARITGGGFGGSIVALVKPSAVINLINAIDVRFFEKNLTKTTATQSNN